MYWAPFKLVKSPPQKENDSLKILLVTYCAKNTYREPSRSHVPEIPLGNPNISGSCGYMKLPGLDPGDLQFFGTDFMDPERLHRDKKIRIVFCF